MTLETSDILETLENHADTFQKKCSNFYPRQLLEILPDFNDFPPFCTKFRKLAVTVTMTDY